MVELDKYTLHSISANTSLIKIKITLADNIHKRNTQYKFTKTIALPEKAKTCTNIIS